MGRCCFQLDVRKARQPIYSDFFEPGRANTGVAILSSGNAGVYEMHKGEVLSLLMKGCDVMMLNFRGYGGSEGEPGEEGTYKDLEAAYQFVKSKGVEDKNIIAWAMCLSGGVAARLANRSQIRIAR